MLTSKLAHGLYHDATVVDYNLFIKHFHIEDVLIHLMQDCERLKLIVLW